MRPNRLFSICLSVLLSVQAIAQGLTHELYINEVMQSTFGGTLDRLNEYPDGWVEIYNPGPDNISLENYRISKKNKFSKGYSLPNYTIPAGSYHVILCDKEDLVSYSTSNPDVVREIHTDFRLSTDEEGGVYLFNPQGELVDSMHLPKMLAMNVGYGRLTDGADSVGYELQITRGEANGGGHGKVLPAPNLNTASWAFGEGSTGKAVKYAKTLKMPDGSRTPDGTIVRYTIDGSEPTEESAILSSNGIVVTQNTVFKAAMYKEGYIRSETTTRVFLYHNRKISIPIVSLVMDHDDLYSEDYGIISNNATNHDKNNWRRPAVFNYFSRGGMKAYMHLPTEVRISGAYSREAALKSMIIYTDKRFGTADYISVPFWSTSRPEAKKVKSFSIRNSGNDFGGSMFRDAVSQMIMGLNTDLDWMAAQPAIFYLNGEYKGIMNIRERGNEDNVWTHYDGLEDITLLENGTLKEGDYQEFLDFEEFYSQPGHTLEEFEERMDVEEFTNWMITNIYQSNTDFPGNNNVMWKPMTEDGRWRFIIKDVDRSFGIWNHSADEEYLNWVTRNPSNIGDGETSNSEYHTRLFRNLLEIPEYRDLFIDRFTVYMGDFLNSGYISGLIDWFVEQMEPEWDSFSALYNKQSSSSWKNEVSNMKSWTTKRTASMYDQIQEFFKLGSQVTVTVNNNVTTPSYYKVKINGVPLTKGTLNGKLYTDREYTFTADYNDTQYDIIGWNVITEKASGAKTTEQYLEEDLTYIIPDGLKSISINAILGTNGIEAIPETDGILNVVRTVYYNVQGISSDVPFKGLNNIKQTLEDGSVIITKKYIE